MTSISVLWDRYGDKTLIVSSVLRCKRLFSDMSPYKTDRGSDKYVLVIWDGIKNKRYRIRLRRVKFQVGQHVRISKQKSNSRRVQKRIIPTKYLKLAKRFARSSALS
jgi:hypothetical protein